MSQFVRFHLPCFKFTYFEAWKLYILSDHDHDEENEQEHGSLKHLLTSYFYTGTLQ